MSWSKVAESPVSSTKPVRLGRRRRRKGAPLKLTSQVGENIGGWSNAAVCNVFFGSGKGLVQTTAIILVKIVPVNGHELHLGPLWEIGRLVQHETTIANVCFDRI